MKLCANAFIGEFGWELFCWQGFLRQMALDGHELYVSCLKGQELLYGDFAKAISSFELRVNKPAQCDNANMWMHAPHVLHFRDLQGIWPDKFDGVVRASRFRTRWWLEEDAPKQAFVSYRQRRASQPKFDVLLSVRDRHMTQYKTEFRNWPLIHAQAVTDALLTAGYSVACVGKSFSSLCTEGAVDYRDVDLYTLRLLMSNARVQIGPQSGPTHFAALCELPQVSWQSKEEHAERTRRFWNPFGVPIITNPAPGDTYWKQYKLWLPKVEWVVQSAINLMELCK